MTESQIHSLLSSRLQALEQRLEAACRRAGRARRDVTLVAVTKTVPVAVAALLPGLGVLDLGENRPQELWRKAAALGAASGQDRIRWHLIGHLQRNKIEQTLPLIQLIHSVDSLRLLSALDEEATRRGQPVAVLLEVNASREPNKHGFVPEGLPEVIPQLAALRHLQVQGLMTMAAYAEDSQHCRPTFAAVRDLRDRLRGELGPPHRLEHLSMGMTNDFEVAIEEGATLVRIGTALFEGLEGRRNVIGIIAHAEGLLLPVRAQPGARRAGIVGEQAGALKVAVTAPPEDGRANKALVEVLREALGLKRSQVELFSGATSRDKRFLIRELTKAELEARLASAVP